MTNNTYFEVKAEFLKTPLEAKLFSKEAQTLLIVQPQKIEKPVEISVNELIAKLKGDNSEIGKAFGNKTDGVKVRLSKAYLKCQHTEAIPASESGAVQVEPVSDVEYAMKLEVVDINTLPVFKTIGDFLTINEVVLAVWNTEDQNVIDDMELDIPNIV